MLFEAQLRSKPCSVEGHVVDVIRPRWGGQARLPPHGDQLSAVVRGVVAHVVDDVGQGDGRFAFAHGADIIEIDFAHAHDEIAKSTRGIDETVEHLRLGEHLIVLHGLVPRGALEGGEPSVLGIPEVANGEV